MNTRKNYVFDGMKRYFSLILFVALFMTACKDDDPKKDANPGGSEITLDGGPYADEKATTKDAALAVYDPQEDITVISFTAEDSDGDEFSVLMAYPGKEKGQKPWTEEFCYVQIVEDMESTDEAVTATFVDPDNDTTPVHTGHIKIDNYGNVGGIVSGSFEGNCTFIDAGCAATSCLTYGTMKGKFEAKRIQ
jgi:hypothetical protein